MSTKAISDLLGLELPFFVKVTDDGRMAFTIDNHLIDTHNQCERKFWLRHIKRLRPKGFGGAALNIGSWWSSMLEWLYNQMKLAQVDPSHFAYPTLMDFMHHAGKIWTEMKMEDMRAAKPKAYEAFGGERGAIAMARSYYEGQGRLDFQHWKVVASEMGFGMNGEVLLYEDKEILIYYMGKPDLVIINTAEDRLLPVEHKTIERVTSMTQRRYKPHPQITGYVYSLNLLAKNIGWDKPVDRCIVNVAGRMPPAERPRDGIKKPRFTRVFPNFSQEELTEWKNGVIGKVKRLKYSLLNDEWLWKESSCHLYAGCEYRRIDSVPPGTRELVIGSDFIQIEPWAPYHEEDEEGEEPIPAS